MATPDPYAWAGSDVLANRLGITDGRELGMVESGLVAGQTYRLGTGELEVPGNGDERHLRDLHRALLGDLYDWAGDYRVGDQPPGGLPAGTIRSDIGHTLRIAGADEWGELTHREMTVAAGETWASLAGAVPFRAGSLAASTVLVDEMAARAGWDIDWERTPIVERLQAVELGHHAGSLDQVKAAVDVVNLGMSRRTGGPKVPVLRPAGQAPGPDLSGPPPPPRRPGLDGPNLGPGPGLGL